MRRDSFRVTIGEYNMHVYIQSVSVKLYGKVHSAGLYSSVSLETDSLTLFNTILERIKRHWMVMKVVLHTEAGFLPTSVCR